MQANSRQGLVSDMVSGLLFRFARAYFLLVLLGGTLTLLVISKLFRNIGGTLVALIVALIIFMYFKQ
ncbi:MAG: hypothetical protein C4583_09585 [Anaerolineaceae bacterium]|nr:MAG: hypothetical protein C4583_09585 [Anaerolineaceae bacterium]